MASEEAILASLIHDEGFSWSSWTKSTHASVRPRPNSSDSSVSARTADLLNLLNVNRDPDSSPTYPLSSVISNISSAATRRHDSTCEEVAKWIRDKANLPVNSEKIKIGVGLPSPTRDDPLWIASRKHPDVSWHEGEVVLQIEVVSSYNAEKTVNKLCLGLVDQLRSWKNRLSSVASIVGFVFPISNVSRDAVDCGQCVKMVKLSWQDRMFQYNAEVIALDAGDVWNALSRVQAEQLRQLNSLRSSANQHFTLPLSDRYVKDTFTMSAYQVKSGESVVILDDEHAYKCPLSQRATHRLHFLSGNPPRFHSYTASAFPQEVVFLGRPFYKFKRYGHPLKVQGIRPCKHAFIEAVIRSLQALHNETGIAHLDIRIENVCWDNEGHAVFIDFDRSIEKDVLIKDGVGNMYGDSLMYPATATWQSRPAWSVDYRQIAIMIGHIEGNTNPHRVPPPLLHPFMQKLYNEGKLT